MRRLETCASTGAAHLSLPGELDSLPGVLASLATPPDVVELNAKCEAAAAQTPPLDAINDPVGAREARAAICACRAHEAVARSASAATVRRIR